MSSAINTAKCAKCGVAILTNTDTPEYRTPCSNCGSTGRNYHVSLSDTAVARDGIGVKAKRAGEKKPYIEDIAAPDYSRSKEKLVHRQRIIDRDKDLYFEQVTDYETGEILHKCEEPLSQHQGHGAAKLMKLV